MIWKQRSGSNSATAFASPFAPSVENLIQTRFVYQTAPGSGTLPGTIRAVTTGTMVLRSDLKFDVAPQWAVAFRGDLPISAKTHGSCSVCSISQPRKGTYQFLARYHCVTLVSTARHATHRALGLSYSPMALTRLAIPRSSGAARASCLALSSAVAKSPFSRLKLTTGQ
jgi:hypothetical protein